MIILDDDFARTLDGISDVLRDVRETTTRTNGVSSITINGGGLGVWIATCCCCVMLGISIIGAAVIIDQGRRIGELNAYLSAIYAQAPSLRPPKEESDQ